MRRRGGEGLAWGRAPSGGGVLRRGAVAVRVGLHPRPHVRAHVVQGEARLPAQRLLRGAGARVHRARVAGAARRQLVRDGPTHRALAGRKHLQHGGAHAGAEVVVLAGLGVWRGAHRAAQRRDVPLREVHHVDVVSHGRAVHGVVVVPEHGERGAAAGDDLLDVGQQVVGRRAVVARGLAQRAAGMRGDGVEVAQQNDAPAGVRGRDVAEHFLDVGLGAAIGGDGPHRVRLVDGQADWIAVHGAGGAEHARLDARARHRAHEVRGTHEVVGVVQHRLLHALAHRLQPRKVDHRVESVPREEVRQAAGVQQVQPFEAHPRGALRPRQCLHPLVRLLVAVAHVVHYHDGAAHLQQRQHRVAANEAEAAGHEHVGASHLQWESIGVHDRVR
mmetsp:Transcript_11810/g.30280  ORF Transcript_11810/g.30280 Transcript_11810/m.30280 type:complete len:388 (+) Transcript_11810:275-1438(+)